MSKHSIAQAARFIYLNQACFNGVFRVNKKGEYNVPFGKKDHLALPSAEQLQRVADRLATATVRCAPYEEILEKVGESDFVYLDPPYPPLNGTAYFTHYTKDRFGVKDQEDLAELTINATKRKCKIMMTNADTPVIRKLYEELNMRPLPVTRFVTCKKEKYKVSELIITNYEMPDSNGTEVPGA
jgi:DNA adenine methylase